MFNKIISIILIMSLNSFLLSEEVKNISDKEVSKIEVKQKKEIYKTEKELDKIERKKTKELKKQNKIKDIKERPEKIKGKKDSDKKEQIQLLKKEFKFNKSEIKKRYRSRIEDLKKSGNNSGMIKQLKSEKKMELGNLKKDFKYELSKIKNS